MGNTYPVLGNIDLPRAGQTVPQKGAIIHGWCLNLKAEGQQPFSCRVYYAVPAEVHLVPIKVRRSCIERPDVAAAFSNGEVRVNRFTGYQLELDTIPVLGPCNLTVEFADSMGVDYSQVSVTVVP